MPLTKTGKKIEKKFEMEYGMKKGKSYFYAWEHSHPFVKKLRYGSSKASKMLKEAYVPFKRKDLAVLR